MNLTQLAIEKNRITIIALAVVFFAGMQAYFTLPRSEDPGFIIRTAVVQTRLPGASPARVEQLVTDKLEKAIQEIPELDFVNSQSKTGVSIVFANFREEYKNMRPIFDNLRRKVDRARGELPDGVIGPNVDDEFGDVFGIMVGISGDPAFSYRELKDIADEVRDELLLINEVAKVEIYGDQDERIFVEYNNARLSELGISPGQLQSILQSQNIIISGGDVRTDYETFVIEPSGNFETVTDLEQTVIPLPGSSQVTYLRDVAEVQRGYIDPPRQRVRVDGGPGLVLAVSMREGGRINVLGEEVNATIERVRGYYPIGIDFNYIQFQPEVVEEVVASFVENLIQAVLIVAGVMLLFLGLRTGLIVSSLIPMAMVSAIFVMSLFDISIDQMSIASLIIALGMLVDNAIVMSESIMVQVGEGKPKLRAAVDSANELRMPLLTSSLTTAAAFLPIFLAESAVGEYTSALFKVVTITLLCSWVLSLTMIPMLCVTFLKVPKNQGGTDFNTRFYRTFRSLLLTGLKQPLLALAGVVVLFFVAVFGLGFVPALFFPDNDRATFTVEIELPLYAPIHHTEEIVREIEEHLEREYKVGPDREEGILNWSTFIGSGAPRFMLSYNPEQSAPNYGVMVVNTTSRPLVDIYAEEIERWIRDRYPDVVPIARALSSGPSSWPPVAIRISGRDTEELFTLVDQVKAKVTETDGAVLLGDSWGSQAKKLFVDINQPRARRAGITNQDIAISLQTFLSGLEVTEFREGDELIPVMLRSVSAERQALDKLETLNVYAQSTGTSVPLSQVADIDVQFQASQILRRDRLKTVTIEAATDPGYTAAAVTLPLAEWLAEESKNWPLGYKYELGGEDEDSAEANASIGAKLPIAGLIIILLLVGQFNSIRRPAIILLTIPLSIIGVTAGLLIWRSYFGFMTLLGIISLAGIVINNAIVLLDRIRIEIDDNGLAPQQAIVESAQRRLRPILLTTCTTLGGLIPLWLGGGAMWEPMAISIIHGLLFATALTLGVVPILYALFFRVSFKNYAYKSAK